MLSRFYLYGLAGTAAIGALALTPALATASPKPANVPVLSAAPAVHGPSALSRSSAAPRTLSAPSVPGASQDGTCDVGDVCLYYFYNFAGSRYDTAHNDPDLSNNHFITPGAGQFAVVGADAESVWNRDNTTLKVCTGPNYTGTCGYVAPNSLGNFTSTFADRVESIIWYDSTN